MKLLEYEAKQLLRRSDVAVPKSQRIIEGHALPTLTFPGVLKSQVPVGGRGKAGGIRVIHDEAALRTAIPEMMNLPIHGFLPSSLLFEEQIAIKRELYLSLTLNRTTASIEFIAHPEGGVEIESHQLAEFFRSDITHSTITAIAVNLTDFYDIPEQAFLLESLLERAFRGFITQDMTLLEINPLIVTTDGRLVAGDAKIEVDAAALFRHQDWAFDTTPRDTNFVILDTSGHVATIANGAGLAMATVDSVVRAGLTPANFLDIGGAASSQSLAQQFAQIATFPHLSAIIINIFGGIVQCDVVAKSIVEARQAFPKLAPLYIRLTGNNAVAASAILEAHGLKNYADLEAIMQELVR